MQHTKPPKRILKMMRRLDGEYIVRLVNLPPGSRGMVIMDEEGFSNIYLDARQSSDAQRENFEHELTHVDNDDFYNDDDIATVESRADAKKKLLKSIPGLKKASDLLPKSIPFTTPKSRPVHPAFASTLYTDEPPKRRVIVGFKLPKVLTGESKPPTEEAVAEAEKKRSPSSSLTPHQRKVLLDALAELDRFVDYPEYDDPMLYCDF